MSESEAHPDNGRPAPERPDAPAGAESTAANSSKPEPQASAPAPDDSQPADRDRKGKGEETGKENSAVVRRAAKFQTSVRWGMLRRTLTLATHLTGLKRGRKVVVQTSRGTELGEVLMPEVPIEADTVKESLGEIIREATDVDVLRAEQGRLGKQDQIFKSARDIIAKHKLPMKLCAIERLLGAERVVFFFRSEGRVDFRTLVKDLARLVRGRVEMFQVGARDEAKLLGDRADCGQSLCCRTFLGTLEPIPMKFAKIQVASLDPQKISGVCGRLKCCLRYEYEVYREFKSNLPERGDFIDTADGVRGKVIDYDIISQTVTFMDREDRRETVGVGQIVSVEKGERPKRKRRKRRGGGGSSRKNRPDGSATYLDGGFSGAGGCGEGGCGAGGCGSGGCSSGGCGTLAAVGAAEGLWV